MIVVLSKEHPVGRYLCACSRVKGVGEYLLVSCALHIVGDRESKVK